MIGMSIDFVPKGPVTESVWIWKDVQREDCIHLGNDAPPLKVAVIEGGMTSGHPSVAIRIDLPDGKHVIADVSARLFCTAARAIMARHADLFQD